MRVLARRPGSQTVRCLCQQRGTVKDYQEGEKYSPHPSIDFELSSRLLLETEDHVQLRIIFAAQLRDRNETVDLTTVPKGVNQANVARFRSVNIRNRLQPPNYFQSWAVSLPESPQKHIEVLPLS